MGRGGRRGVPKDPLEKMVAVGWGRGRLRKEDEGGRVEHTKNKKAGQLPRRLVLQRRLQRRPRAGLCHKIAGAKLSLVSKQRIFREGDINLGKEDRLVVVVVGDETLDSYYSPPPVHTTSMLLHPPGRRGDGPWTWRRWRWGGGLYLQRRNVHGGEMRGDNVLAKVCRCASGMNLHEMRLSRASGGPMELSRYPQGEKLPETVCIHSDPAASQSTWLGKRPRVPYQTARRSATTCVRQ